MEEVKKKERKKGGKAKEGVRDREREGEGEKNWSALNTKELLEKMCVSVCVWTHTYQVLNNKTDYFTYKAINFYKHILFFI